MAIILVSVLSAIGICERCKVESGGVYFLLSYVLGSRIAAAVGLLYCFGQVKYNLLCYLTLLVNEHAKQINKYLLLGCWRCSLLDGIC